jgi:hypothetical protein
LAERLNTMTIWQAFTTGLKNGADESLGKHPYLYGTIWGIAIVGVVLSLAGVI